MLFTQGNVIVGACVQTLHVGAFDHACVQVSPVESMVYIVNGQSVGPAHFIHQGCDGAAIHVGSGYTRATTPLSPVHVAAATKHCFILGPTYAKLAFSILNQRTTVVSVKSVFFKLYHLFQKGSLFPLFATFVLLSSTKEDNFLCICPHDVWAWVCDHKMTSDASRQPCWQLWAMTSSRHH